MRCGAVPASCTTGLLVGLSNPSGSLFGRVGFCSVLFCRWAFLLLRFPLLGIHGQSGYGQPHSGVPEAGALFASYSGVAVLAPFLPAVTTHNAGP
jgi:hypothetical protein